MKKLYFLFILIFLSHTTYSQITYVDASATGANDGSSWENAFTELQNALDLFAGQPAIDEAIWIAAGEYKPVGGIIADTSSTFLVEADVDIYGGFAGTESALEERDTEANVTILSGDLNGDDGSSIDSLLRLDNSRHVMLISSELNKTITIDGITFTGGNTSDNPDAEFIQRAGGAIMSFSPINVNNCIFTNNFGRSGASIAIDGATNPNAISKMIISNCVFDENEASAQSAGVVLYEMLDVEILNCTFTNNVTNRGCLYPNTCGTVLVKDCLFEDNTNENFGGGMFVWQTMDLTLDGNTFKNNTARSAAGMYCDSRDIAFDNSSVTVKNCTFNGNECTDGSGTGFMLWQTANAEISDCTFMSNKGGNGTVYLSGSDSPTKGNPDLVKITNCQFSSNEVALDADGNDGRGGGIYAFGASYTVETCNFLGNSAVSTGAGIYNTGANKEVVVRDCVFGNNFAEFGGAITNYGDTTNVFIEDCSFLLNEATVAGGSLLCGFLAGTTLKNVEMKNGNANFGGAISIQNDSTSLSVLSCAFETNAATSNGGVLNSTDDSHWISFEHSVFNNNTGNFGGALNLIGNDSTDLDVSYFSLKNSYFNDNTAGTQGGAISIVNKNGIVENCLINDNTANGTGAGGAISVNATMEKIITLDLVNSTLVNNVGFLASGISAFTADNGQAITKSINTLYNNLGDYRIEDGNPEFISLGGNASRDLFFQDLFLDTDILGQNPLFVNEASRDYRLQETSPCRDAGVPGGAVEEITGAERDGMPDIGAFEFGIMSAIDDPVYTQGISLFPNPASELINIEVEALEFQPALITIFDNVGKVVKVRNTDEAQINVAGLENGVYHLMLQQNGKRYVSSFMKI